VTSTGVAKLVDFGIAKATNQANSSTQTGEVKGKFSYMAPEQIRCQPVDRRADLFACGIMLYALTTGQHPFKSDNPAGMLHRITDAEPPLRPSRFVPTYSRTLEAVVMKALAKDPADRFESAAAMQAALRRAVPHAFTPEFEAGELRQFADELIAGRCASRREAFKQAQVAADARAPGISNLNHGASQSGSSLRALSIDARDSAAPNSAPVPRRNVAVPLQRSGWSTWGATAAILGAIAVTAYISPLVSRRGSPTSATGSGESARPAPAVHAAPPVSVTSTPEPAAPVAQPAPEPSAAAPTSSVASPGKPRAPERRASPRKAVAPKESDLLSPY
jgi:serine/threonine-protein kinase